MNTIVAQHHQFIVGVDTHARTHTFSVLAASGANLGTETFPNTPSGRSRAIGWASRRTGGEVGVLWAIEGAGSYGAQLARAVANTGYTVVEAPRVNVHARHGMGKSDPLDATAIASTTLSLPLNQLRTPRQDEGIRAATRILLTARDELTAERTRAVNALTALLRIVDLGIDARRSLSTAQITETAHWRTRNETLVAATARVEATRLAKRIVQLDAEIASSTTRLKELVEASPAAELLERAGIGPVTAATALVAWSHPGRVKSEAAFAAIAGVNPIPASSGNTTRHRLNRSGDRRLNRALHVIAMIRMTRDPVTRDYVEKRRTEGKTDREIRRALKRYLARSIYRQLNAASATEKALDKT